MKKTSLSIVCASRVEVCAAIKFWKFSHFLSNQKIEKKINVLDHGDLLDFAELFVKIAFKYLKIHMVFSFTVSRYLPNRISSIQKVEVRLNFSKLVQSPFPWPCPLRVGLKLWFCATAHFSVASFLNSPTNNSLWIEYCSLQSKPRKVFNGCAQLVFCW